MSLLVTRFNLPSNMRVTSALLRIMRWRLLLLLLFPTHRLLLLSSHSCLHLLLTLMTMVAAGRALLLTCSRTTA